MFDILNIIGIFFWALFLFCSIEKKKYSIYRLFFNKKLYLYLTKEKEIFCKNRSHFFYLNVF